MNSRHIPLSLLAVALAFSATGQAQTLKVSKAKVRPAGYSTVGAFAEPGCCDTAPGCGECCPTCGPCCPRVIPAILRGIDCVLNKIFCCHCCDGCGVDPCCGADLCQPLSYRAHAGCCDAPGGSPVMAPQPSDPFIEDAVEAPVTRMDPRLYRRGTTTPRTYGTIRKGRGEFSIYSNGVPRPLPVHEASPLKSSQTAKSAPNGRSSAVRATSNDNRDMVIPANPLRP